MRPVRLLFIVGALLASYGVRAVEVLNAMVEKTDGVYHVLGTSLVQASPEFIFATLMDFENFHKISSGITDTHFVKSAMPGEILGYTRIETCVLFFCRHAEKLERVEATPNTEIRTEVIPEQSDFKSHNARWTLVRQGEATRLTYEAEFQPDFWMPPLISTWAIKRKLISSAEHIGLRMEYLSEHKLTLAQIREPVPVPDK